MKMVVFFIETLLQCAPKSPFNSNEALVLKMACLQIGNTELLEPMTVLFTDAYMQCLASIC